MVFAQYLLTIFKFIRKHRYNKRKDIQRSLGPFCSINKQPVYFVFKNPIEPI